MAKLNYIGRTDHLVNFSCNSSVEELQDWFNKQRIVQFDTETNVTNSIVSRHLKVLQFGSLDGSEVFVIQWSFLTDDQKELVLKLLKNNEVLKIIHNASFDYQMMLKSGVVMENVWDTMVMEQCLYAGHDFDLRFFSLASVLLRRYYIDVSKESQSEFGDDIINDEKLVYAATDVVHLGRLYEDQRRELINEDLIQLGEGEYTENEALLAFADMEYYGMGFDPVKWRDNIALAEPIVEDATNKLTAILTQEPYLSLGKELNINAKLISPSGRERTVEMPAILPEDFVTVNWNSSPQALEVLQLIPIFEDLEKASVLELKKFLQERDPKAPKVNDKGKPIGVTSKTFTEYVNDMSPDWFVFIKLLINKDYSHLEEAFKMNFRDKLIEHKYLIPKGSVMINWNSNLAKLAVFRWFNSEVENTDADTVDNNIDMPFFQAYKQYNNANSLLTKYGEKFIEKHVDIDGRVRTRYNTVLSTGRVSSSQPNVQQIPVNALPRDRQKDYRNCFIPGRDGWSIVGADYSSQELCVIATLSQDPIFIDALKTGKDLHSVCAELVWGTQWTDATDKDCAFYKLKEDGQPAKSKCKCAGHVKLRDDTKAVSFGLAYGLSPKGLANDIHVTVEEASQIFDRYFIAFEGIKSILDGFGEYGKNNGFIRTIAPFRRKRYFPYWNGPSTAKGLLSQIERASKNMPIQGSSADMIKIAMINMRRWINTENLRDVVQMFVQVHDEINLNSRDDYAELTAQKLTEFMEKAAEIVLNNTLLKAESEITKKW